MRVAIGSSSELGGGCTSASGDQMVRRACNDVFKETAKE